MRRVILFIGCSLDGFIAGSKDEIDWLFTDQDYGYKHFYNSVDTLLIGRKTYKLALTFGEWPYEGKKCYVFSRKQVKDSRVIVSKDPIGIVKKLLRQEGKDIWLVGGGKLISALLNKGLIHEMRIFVHPIILGKGIPMFPGIKKHVKLKTIRTVRFNSGLVELEYKVK